jgi:hypothetical protein
MGLVIAILVLALIGLVVLVVGAPLRRAHQAADSALTSAAPAPDPASSRAHARDELEAAREAKYREIRDTELDYRTGKLSSEDYQAIDADLRAEAIEILDRLERLSPREP